MATPYRLRIVTARGTLFEDQVTYAHVAGTEGEMGILAHHLPLVTALRVAPLEVELASGGRRRFAVHGGFLEVGREGVTVLAEVAEAAEDIDVERARQQMARAQEALAQAPGPEERQRAEEALARAKNRLAAAGAALSPSH